MPETSALAPDDRGHRPATVLMLIDCLNLGGSETQLLLHLRSVDRARWRPIVGCFHEGGTLLGDVLALAAPVTVFPLHTSLAHPNTALPPSPAGGCGARGRACSGSGFAAACPASATSTKPSHLTGWKRRAASSAYTVAVRGGFG